MRELTQKIILCFFVILLCNVKDVKAQWVFPYPTSGAPCSSCVPPGWTMVSGSPDISSLNDWIGYSHYMSTGVVNPVPEPAPGVTSFMSAMAYSSGTEEVTTSFTLAAPQVLTVYFGGFGTSISGGGPAGAQPGVTENLVVNGASVSQFIPWDGQWHAVTYNLPAGVNTITLDPSIGDDNDRHAVHISIPVDQPGTCIEDLVDLSTPTTICLGDELTLEVSSVLGGNITWDGGVTNGTPFTPGTTGVFTYNAASDDIDDCPFTTQVIVNDIPLVQADPDISICTGESIILNATGASTYVWDIGLQNGDTFTPAATSTIYVTGTDGNNCSALDSMLITLVPLTTIEAGPNQNICVGDVVTLSGSGGAAYAWDNGVVDGVAFAPAATEIYTVIDPNGCSESDSLTVTVNALPAIDSGADAIVCEGDSILLDATGGDTYVWDIGLQNGDYYTPTASSTINVTGTDVNGCISADPMIITVVPVLVIDAGPNQTICAGEVVTLSATGGLNYTWDNGVIDGVAFAPNATQVYTVIDINGCSASDNLTVTVNQLPTVNAGADASICIGDSVLLNATGATTYVWDIGLQNGDYFIAATTAAINVVGTDANGCVATDNMTVTVNPLPIVDAGNNQLICEGSETTLSASGSGTPVWNNGVVDGIPFLQTDPSVMYTATSTDANGCVNMDSVLVTLETIPTVSFTADVLAGCSPLTVTFSNTTSGNLTDCLWTFEGNGSIGDCGNVTVTFDQSGTYDVTLMVNTVTGCVSTGTYTDYIYVEADPIASFTITPDNVSSLYPEVSLVNTSTGAVTYNWDFDNDAAGSTSEDAVYLYPQEEGGYMIELIAYSELGCADTAYNYLTVYEELVYFIPNTFTPDGNMHNQNFYPVFTSGVDAYDYEFKIFNRWGEELFTSQDPEIGWDGTYTNGLCQDGIYTWRIEFKLKDGDERQIITGHVNLMR